MTVISLRFPFGWVFRLIWFLQSKKLMFKKMKKNVLYFSKLFKVFFVVMPVLGFSLSMIYLVWDYFLALMTAGHNWQRQQLLQPPQVSISVWYGGRDKDAFASDMTELPPTALGQQAAGLIAKVAVKESSRGCPKLYALSSTWRSRRGMRAQSAKSKNVKPKW